MSTTSKKIGGFMCQSPAAVAVCISVDPRSAIVPRKPARASINGDHARLVRNAVKYSKLLQSPSLSLHSDRRKPLSVSNSSRQQPDLVVHKSPMALQKPASVLSSPDDVFQVVVMRVALHCQGCASKVKRHLSKMEGVTSFSIDLEAKRVTVMGHISPEGVLESISKVKRAELWPC